ncbi:MAG: hypothetical protein U5L11_05640 [Arhodomonas sp.]|nr:hypothetical protein [Arhodomonas sp.]
MSTHGEQAAAAFPCYQVRYCPGHLGGAVGDFRGGGGNPQLGVASPYLGGVDMEDPGDGGIRGIDGTVGE